MVETGSILLLISSLILKIGTIDYYNRELHNFTKELKSEFYDGFTNRTNSVCDFGKFSNKYK